MRDWQNVDKSKYEKSLFFDIKEHFNTEIYKMDGLAKWIEMYECLIINSDTLHKLNDKKKTKYKNSRIFKALKENQANNCAQLSF